MRQMIAAAAVLAVTFAFTAARASAQPVVIGVDQGAVFDAVLDGFPTLAVLDGVPDFGGNALGIALKSGSTEERGIGEFPLAALAGVAAEDVASATLTFNIDDTLTTFGPGTEFSGAACEEILVHLYAGDGAVAVGDFVNVDRTAHVVDTRPLGPITDTSLRTTGALTFEVDVTDDVRALLAENAPAVGVVWRTMDTPTGTSIDNLGDGAAGPPGVNGSFMPFLTVELGAEPTVTPTLPPTPTATPAPNTPTTGPDTPTVISETPTSTFTVDPGATPTATAPAACPGDCDGDGTVAVNELITGVNLALGNVASCDAMDGDEDERISIAELIRAVGALLEGC